jgi:hydroxypyruvate isomerase
MPKFAANLTMLFTDLGFLDRFEAGLAGIAPDGVPEDTVRETFVDNLKFAADRLKAAGKTEDGLGWFAAYRR